MGKYLNSGKFVNMGKYLNNGKFNRAIEKKYKICVEFSKFNIRVVLKNTGFKRYRKIQQFFIAVPKKITLFCMRTKTINIISAGQSEVRCVYDRSD